MNHKVKKSSTCFLVLINCLVFFCSPAYAEEFSRVKIYELYEKKAEDICYLEEENSDHPNKKKKKFIAAYSDTIIGFYLITFLGSSLVGSFVRAYKYTYEFYDRYNKFNKKHDTTKNRLLHSLKEILFNDALLGASSAADLVNYLIYTADKNEAALPLAGPFTHENMLNIVKEKRKTKSPSTSNKSLSHIDCGIPISINKEEAFDIIQKKATEILGTLNRLELEMLKELFYATENWDCIDYDNLQLNSYLTKILELFKIKRIIKSKTITDPENFKKTTLAEGFFYDLLECYNTSQASDKYVGGRLEGWRNDGFHPELAAIVSNSFAIRPRHGRYEEEERTNNEPRIVVGVEEFFSDFCVNCNNNDDGIMSIIQEKEEGNIIIDCDCGNDGGNIMSVIKKKKKDLDDRRFTCLEMKIAEKRLFFLFLYYASGFQKNPYDEETKFENLSGLELMINKYLDIILLRLGIKVNSENRIKLFLSIVKKHGKRLLREENTLDKIYLPMMINAALGSLGKKMILDILKNYSICNNISWVGIMVKEHDLYCYITNTERNTERNLITPNDVTSLNKQKKKHEIFEKALAFFEPLAYMFKCYEEDYYYCLENFLDKRLAENDEDLATIKKAKRELTRLVTGLLNLEDVSNYPESHEHCVML